jgi:hypothetical protein
MQCKRLLSSKTYSYLNLFYPRRNCYKLSSMTTTPNFAYLETLIFAGLQELVVNNDRSVVDGDGNELLFEKNADNTYNPHSALP